jgi:hypothetical protein
MVCACYYREGKSVPKFWYERYVFLCEKWRAIDNFVEIDLEKLENSSHCLFSVGPPGATI